MSALLEMLITASLVSGAAIVCLRLLPGAPPRLRFRIALVGLAAWTVPWPLLHVPVELPAAQVVSEWRDGFLQAAAGRSAGESVAADAGRPNARTNLSVSAAVRQAPADPSMHEPVHLGAAFWLAVLFVPGMFRFLWDVIVLRRSVAAWRAASFPGDALRASLPVELRNVPASIRIVSGSSVAATSGWFRPTVWLGERLDGRDLDVALVHELTHVSRRDPVWITLVTAIRRAWWWNPAVGWLGREAVLMIESDCDRGCARWLGTGLYVERLASMMLDAAAPSSLRLAAHARSPSLNVQRLKLLAHTPGMRLRDYAAIVLSSCLATTTAAYAVAESARAAAVPNVAHTRSTAAMPEWAAARSQSLTAMPGTGAAMPGTPAAIPETAAGRVLERLLRAYNAGDTERLAELLGAFTPMEVAFRVPASSGGLDVIDILASAPMRIDYVARDRVGGAQRIGVLELDPHSPMRILRADIIDAAR